MKSDFIGMSAEVQWFANEMQAKLDANSHKGGWHHCNYKWLLNRLKQETKELERALDDGENVVQEAADVANFAMMIADKFAELESERQHKGAE